MLLHTAQASTPTRNLQPWNPQVWSVADNARVFLGAVAAFHVVRAADVGATLFDKDDALAVSVVSAAANLRSACYGIPLQSEFAVKGMAGNIIHAIATTNAIISGLIVVEALKLVAGCGAAHKKTYLMVRCPAVTACGVRCCGVRC